MEVEKAAHSQGLVDNANDLLNDGSCQLHNGILAGHLNTRLYTCNSFGLLCPALLI